MSRSRDNQDFLAVSHSLGEGNRKRLYPVCCFRREFGDFDLCILVGAIFDLANPSRYESHREDLDVGPDMDLRLADCIPVVHVRAPSQKLIA